MQNRDWKCLLMMSCIVLCCNPLFVSCVSWFNLAQLKRFPCPFRWWAAFMTVRCIKKFLKPEWNFWKTMQNTLYINGVLEIEMVQNLLKLKSRIRKYSMKTEILSVVCPETTTQKTQIQWAQSSARQSENRGILKWKTESRSLYCKSTLFGKKMW